MSKPKLAPRQHEKGIPMWIFTKNGHLSLGQHAGDHDCLVVRSQLREDIERFVALLDSVGDRKHEVQDTAEGDYHYLVTARRAVVAEAVARTVAAIDYDKLVDSVHFDFGKQPGFLLWLNPTGLQVARVSTSGRHPCGRRACGILPSPVPRRA
jgi:hypothetical protein